MRRAPVAVAIVTHDSAADLPECLAALARLDPAPAELVVADCASTDGSVAIVRRSSPAGIEPRVLELAENRGFAGGTNAAIAATASPWVLTLNADAFPAPDFLARLLELAGDPRCGRVGAVAGRLVRPTSPPRLDACGMRLVRSWRHLDRGSGEPDRGQYGAPERVFGATGAASLWSRAALEDVAIDGELFDERFHSYREDAELCFRLREREWEVVYAPEARCVHRRRVTPEGRRGVAAAINRRSLQNRYLLRAGHQTAANLLATLPWTLARDLGALAWVLAFERSSLPAYGWLVRHRREIRERRRRLRARRTAAPGAVERWFGRPGEPL
jgi:GT2 family glycosyltransferase